MTLGCSVAKEHAVLKIKYNEDHSTNLIKTSPADKIYDIESYHCTIWFSKNLLRPTATLSTYLLNYTRTCARLTL